MRNCLLETATQIQFTCNQTLRHFIGFAWIKSRETKKWIAKPCKTCCFYRTIFCFVLFLVRAIERDVLACQLAIQFLRIEPLDMHTWTWLYWHLIDNIQDKTSIFNSNVPILRPFWWRFFIPLRNICALNHFNSFSFQFSVQRGKYWKFGA